MSRRRMHRVVSWKHCLNCTSFRAHSPVAASRELCILSMSHPVDRVALAIRSRGLVCFPCSFSSLSGRWWGGSESVHALVHNAGITRDRSLRRMMQRGFDDVISVRSLCSPPPPPVTNRTWCAGVCSRCGVPGELGRTHEAHSGS
mgnify:CR=1 FL=1